MARFHLEHMYKPQRNLGIVERFRLSQAVACWTNATFDYSTMNYCRCSEIVLFNRVPIGPRVIPLQVRAITYNNLDLCQPPRALQNRNAA